MRGVLSLVVSLLACSLVAGCNEADVVAHPVDVGGNMQDASNPLDCDTSAQLRRHGLPVGLSNLAWTCEWTLSENDDSSVNDIGWLAGEMGVRTSNRDWACERNPYWWWPEPSLPLIPKRLVFCPAACAQLKAWVDCQLRDDPCNADRELDYDDAGVDTCDWLGAPRANTAP